MMNFLTVEIIIFHCYYYLILHYIYWSSTNGKRHVGHSNKLGYKVMVLLYLQTSLNYPLMISLQNSDQFLLKMTYHGWNF